MTKSIQPFEVTRHASDLGHSMVTGPIRSGKTVSAELVKLWWRHPGGSTLVAQAVDNDGE